MPSLAVRFLCVLSTTLPACLFDGGDRGSSAWSPMSGRCRQERVDAPGPAERVPRGHRAATMGSTSGQARMSAPRASAVDS
jgi:hypothetical protein